MAAASAVAPVMRGTLEEAEEGEGERGDCLVPE